MTEPAMLITIISKAVKDFFYCSEIAFGWKESSELSACSDAKHEAIGEIL